MRTVSLATVLLAPIGEKAFTERANGPKEQAVAMAELDQESDQLEQEEDSESLDLVTEQKELIKEKYGAEIIGDNSEYTLEELQDFESALNKVQEFAPEKFAELKLVILKINSQSFYMAARENLSDDIDEIKDIKSSYKQDKYPDINAEIKLHELENEVKTIDGYDVIVVCDKKRLEETSIFEKSVSSDVKEKIPTVDITSDIQKNDIYKNIFVHELSHLITTHNPSEYEGLSDKFKNINKKTSSEGESKIIIHLEDLKSNIERYPGFVTAYAATGGQAGLFRNFLDKYKYNEEDVTFEDTGETVAYMINDYHYADNDPLVQEKVKAVQEFLNEKSDDKK